MKNTAEQIKAHLMAGHTVVISTAYKAWKFNKPAHAEYFKTDKEGNTLMARGRNWDRIATDNMVLVSIRCYA